MGVDVHPDRVVWRLKNRAEVGSYEIIEFGRALMMAASQPDPEKFVAYGAGGLEMIQSGSVTRTIFLTTGNYAGRPDPWILLVSPCGMSAPGKNRVWLPGDEEFREIGSARKAVEKKGQLAPIFFFNRF